MRVLLALVLGVVTGWFAMPDLKPLLAGDGLSFKGTKPEVMTPRVPNIEVKKPLVSGEEMLAVLYNIWDEAGAVDWLATLPVEELVRLLIACDELPDKFSAMWLQVAIRDAIARTDLELALKLAKESPKEMSDVNEGCVLGGLAVGSPKDAVARARALNRERGSGSSFIDGAMYFRWLQKDLDGVLNWWDTDPDEGTGTGALQAYLSTLPLSQLPAVARRIDAMKRPDMRAAMMKKVMEHWADADPVEAGRYTLTMKEPLKGDEVLGADALRQWAALAPMDALRSVLGLNASVMREQAITQVMNELSGSDQLSMVLQFSTSLPEEQRRVLREHLAKVDEFHVSSAVMDEVVQALGDSPQRDHIMRDTAKAWARDLRLEDAVRLAQSIPTASERHAAWLSIGGDLARARPQDAANWVQSLPANDRSSAAYGVGLALADDGPETALPWLATVTEPSLQHLLMRRIAQRWAEIDPAAASAWLDTQPGMNRVLKAELMGE